ncbi:hypothetical protein ACHQM5_012348 [Ranunculus cassubicifolius]
MWRIYGTVPKSHNTIQFASNGYHAWPKSYYQSRSLAKFSSGSRSMSSQAGSESSEEEGDLEEGFSELETPSSEITKDTNEEDSLSESDLALSDDDELTEDSHKEVDLPEIELTEDAASKKKVLSLTKIIIDANRNSLVGEFNKWDKKGKSLERSDVLQIMLNLRRRRMFGKALEFSEWLERTKKITFTDRDYASRLDLIFKVRGLERSQRYLKDIPESDRSEVVYRTHLANCVTLGDRKKSEDVFNKMRDLKLPLTAFACNQLLILYKKLDKKKIGDILLLMEEESVKPTNFTYKLLMDAKGQSNDIAGMEKLLESMKEQGLEVGLPIQTVLAKHYINGQLNEKAEEVLKQIEGDDLKNNRFACGPLLIFYADLRKEDEVARVWEVCDSNPRVRECHAAIQAWGTLGKVEEAEKVFERIEQIWKKLSPSSYFTLLKVYANHKMLCKGKELVKKMADSGLKITPWMWDSLVKLYVDAGELSKADMIIEKAAEKHAKPLFNTYISVLEQYAKRGDVHNAERMFLKLKQSGYGGRIRQYQSLLEAYVHAKAPAYGFRERMQADQVFPNKVVAAKLVLVDGYMKKQSSELSELLD